ncbi:MAG: MFS transporter [Pseudomonadota bacterium]
MTVALETTIDDAPGDRALYRRALLRIMPIIVFTYFVCYIDRISISFLKLRMLDDLGFSEITYSFGVGLFFWGYLLFQAPISMIVARVGARRSIAVLSLIWGVLSAAMMTIQSASGFYVLRFLLGVGEAAFFPAVLLYFTQWFPARRQGRVMSFLFLATPLGVVLGGPAVGWVMEAADGVQGLVGWRWAFLLSALPSLAAAGLVAFVLKDRPAEAAWLAPDEAARLTSALEQDVQGRTSAAGQALRSPLVWLLALICFLYNIGHYGLLFWSPTIIQAFGLESPARIGLLSAVPYATACVAMLVTAASSERRRERRLHCALPITFAGFALAASAMTATNLPVSMLFLSLAVAGVTTTLALFWSIPGGLLSGAAAAAGVAFINSAAVVAGMIGPGIVGVVKQASGSASAGMLVLSVVLLAAGGLILCIPRHVWRQLDR